MSMKSVEFEGIVGPDRQMTIPEDIARQLPAGAPLHVLLEWDGAGDHDDGWRDEGRRRFEAAFAPEDVVYEQLIDETRVR